MMRNALQLLCAAAVTLLGAPLQAAPDGDALGKQLTENAPECGTFAQTRWLADLEAQLDSRGQFHRERGALVWHTTAPVEDRVVLSEDNAELPTSMQVILPVLMGLLSGDWDALERNFRIALRGSLDAWQARLTSRDAAVAERVSRVAVRGGERVESIEVAFRGGDRLVLVLTPAACEDITRRSP
jgi:hypothetical protein